MMMMIRASGEKKDEDGDGVDDMMAKVVWTLAWQEKDRIRMEARLNRCHPRWRDQRRVMQCCHNCYGTLTGITSFT